jgi:hypothetical protein
LSTFAIEEGEAAGPDGAGGEKLFKVGIICLGGKLFEIGIICLRGGGPQPGLGKDLVMSDPEEEW